jgi:WD40 repeat protein
MQEDPRPFRAVKPDLPALPQLEGVVMKALTKDRDQRYGSVLEFAREFAQAAAAGSEPPAQPEPQREAAKPHPQAEPAAAPNTIVPAAVRDTVPMKPVPERPHPSRRKWLVIAGCFVFLLATAAAGVWYRTWWGSRPAQRQFESPPAITFSPFVLQRTLTGSIDSVRSIAFSPAGSLLASAGGENTIKLWDVASGTLRRELTGHSTAGLAFSPDGKLLASAGGAGLYDFNIKLWDVAEGTVKQTLTGYHSVVDSVAFSPEGNLLASGNSEYPPGVIPAQPDGKLLASWHDTLKLWELTTGTLRQTLTGNQESYFPLVFSPDGRLLAYGRFGITTGPDGKHRAWSATIKL